MGGGKPRIPFVTFEANEDMVAWRQLNFDEKRL